MKIGLIDSDLLDKNCRYPNLALMKMSNFYKNEGHQVDLIDYSEINEVDKIYVSKVFYNTEIPDYLDPEGREQTLNLFADLDIEYGGTGFDFDKEEFLPDEIEHCYPDYELYNEYVQERLQAGENRRKYKYYLDYSLGFTTRFCFRGCKFCVNRNRSKVVKWADINEFYNPEKPKINLFDDNILGYPGCVEIIRELNSIEKPYRFNQGLDIRVLTKEKAEALAAAHYDGDYTFAFDNLEEKELVLEKLKLWKQYTDARSKFYVLTGFKGQDVENIVKAFKRVKILAKHGVVPYIMRHKNYKKSKWKGIYICLAGWVNQLNLFKKMSFREFCQIKNKATQRYLRQFEKEHPEVADTYFDFKYSDCGGGY